jgi:16S rRNA A1518/A1519 N6-dimethyltransferase RsmA/KsgA/DIM1 with predicted DNA glycosylase/AP lyase activity
MELQDLKIDWKGFRFRFTTYEDERLRNIQLEAIEAELVQAIGRARSLRTDAEVLVYSNLPLHISTLIIK